MYFHNWILLNNDIQLFYFHNNIFFAIWNSHEQFHFIAHIFETFNAYF